MSFGSKFMETAKSFGSDLLDTAKESLATKSDTLKEGVVDSINDVTSEIKLPSIDTGLDKKTMFYGIALVFGAILLFFGMKSNKAKSVYSRAKNTYRRSKTFYSRRRQRRKTTRVQKPNITFFTFSKSGKSEKRNTRVNNRSKKNKL